MTTHLRSLHPEETHAAPSRLGIHIETAVCPPDSRPSVAHNRFFSSREGPPPLSRQLGHRLSRLLSWQALQLRGLAHARAHTHTHTHTHLYSAASFLVAQLPRYPAIFSHN